MMRLDDEDYKCLICVRVFIRPILLDCSHMFCELCIDRWIVNNQNCPTCDNSIVKRAYCLSIDNFIKRMKEKMSEDKVKKKFNKLEESRAEDKSKSKIDNDFF
uniref:E3 ubiquitin-protein ligase n=1 Tax=Schizaphis graminum TaxID=13262 RepID=A0A2S2PIR7_SCHGA